MERMTSNSSSKLFSDSGQKCYESSRTDSGFLSGANLVSEENLSVENLSAVQSGLNVDSVEKYENCMQLDSGVDLGLNEQFSGLTLHHDVVNNAKNKLSSSSKTNSISSKTRDENLSEILIQPWELYFQQDEEGDTSHYTEVLQKLKNFSYLAGKRFQTFTNYVIKTTTRQLHIAIIQGFIEVVYTLIRMAPHPFFLDIHNDVTQAPLHLAVLTHQPRIVRRLVVAGANVETRDKHGNTPLHLACRMGDIECVKSLTEPISVSEAGKAGLLYSGYTQQVPQDFEERNYDGETCFHLAAYNGHIDILRHLIWFGANINAREDKSGRTVLHFAVETLNHKLLRFLLDECSFGPNGLLIDTRNYAGHTAYQLARLLDAKVAEDLVSRGARVGVEDIDEDDDEHPNHNAEDEMNDLGDNYSREALPVQ